MPLIAGSAVALMLLVGGVGVAYWAFTKGVADGGALSKHLQAPALPNPFSNDHQALCDRVAAHVNAADDKLQQAIRTKGVRRDAPELVQIRRDCQNIYSEVALLELISAERGEELRKRFDSKTKRSFEEIETSYYDYRDARDRNQEDPVRPLVLLLRDLHEVVEYVIEGRQILPPPANDVEEIEYERLEGLRDLQAQIAKLDSRDGFFELVPTMKELTGRFQHLALRRWDLGDSKQRMSSEYHAVDAHTKNILILLLTEKIVHYGNQEDFDHDDLTPFLLAINRLHTTENQDREGSRTIDPFITAFEEMWRANTSIVDAAGQRRPPVLVQQREQLAAEEARKREESQQRDAARRKAEEAAAAEQERLAEQKAASQADDSSTGMATAGRPDEPFGRGFGRGPRRPDISTGRGTGRASNLGIGPERSHSAPRRSPPASSGPGTVRIAITGGENLDWTAIRDSLVAATGARSHALRRSGDSGTITFDYSGGLAKIEALIDFGTVTKVDEATRTLHVRAE